MDRRLGKFKAAGTRRARLRRLGADTQFRRQRRSRPQARVRQAPHRQRHNERASLGERAI